MISNRNWLIMPRYVPQRYAEQERASTVDETLARRDRTAAARTNKNSLCLSLSLSSLRRHAATEGSYAWAKRREERDSCILIHAHLASSVRKCELNLTSVFEPNKMQEEISIKKMPQFLKNILQRQWQNPNVISKWKKLENFCKTKYRNPELALGWKY